MAKLSTRSIRLREFLRRNLEQNKMSYPKLAKAVNVSLPTIKRWMTKDDFPMQALDNILRALDLNWRDVVGALDVIEVRRQPWTKRLEEAILSHPKAFVVWILLFHNTSYEQILSELRTKPQDLEVQLHFLNKWGIIDYRSKEDIRVLRRGPMRWSENSPASQLYYLPSIQMIFREILAVNIGFGSSFKPAMPLIRVGEMYLTPKSLVRFKADLSELVEKYFEISRLEVKTRDREELSPAAFLLTLDRFPLWKRLLWDGSA